MLELLRVLGGDRDDGSVNVKFSHDRDAIFEFRSESVVGTFTKAQQTDQNVLLKWKTRTWKMNKRIDLKKEPVSQLSIYCKIEASRDKSLLECKLASVIK